MSKVQQDFFYLTGLKAKMILVLACILCYAVTIRNNFSLDDDFAFYENQYVQQGIKGIPDILTHTYLNTGVLSLDYRPIGGITFAIEHQLFGNNPHEAHVVNIILYIICVLLVFAIFTGIFSVEIFPAFVITLFYAVHPAHTEVVASIKNREEILSFIFAMLAFLNIHKLFDQKTAGRQFLYAILVLGCLMLSLTSKLTSMPTVIVMILSLYYRGLHERKNLFYGISSMMVAMTIAYFYLIYTISNRPIYDLENPIVMYDDLSSKLGMAASSLWFYFHFLFVPYPFSFFYGYNTIPVITLNEPVAVLSTFLHLALFIYGAILFLKKDIVGFFILAYFVAISVYANIPMVYTGIVSERAMFFASMWFVAAICYLLYQKVYSGNNTFLKNTLTVFAVIVLVIYGALDINRSMQWHDPVTLMRSDIDHLDNSTLANYFFASTLKNYADAHMNDTAIHKKYIAEAEKYLHQTIAISPGYPYGYFKMGLIYRYDKYVPDSAYYFFKKAFALNPSLTDVAYQCGRTEYEFGDMKLSNQIFTDLYQKIPNDTFTVFYHALLLIKTGQPQEGHRINARMIQMAPDYYQPYFNEGWYYRLVNDADHAVQQYETSVKLGCTDQDVYKYMIDYYEKHNRAEDAQKILKLMH